MSFEGASILTAGLAKIELPHVTLRLCDGGFVIKAGELYRTFHEDFGTIAAIEPISESLGDSLPEGRMLWLPSSISACRCWAAKSGVPANISRKGAVLMRIVAYGVFPACCEYGCA